MRRLCFCPGCAFGYVAVALVAVLPVLVALGSVAAILGAFR